jgi:hypothetical protein
MNVNTDKRLLKKYKFGGLVDRAYSFEIRWFSPENINQPYEVNKKEVESFKAAIKKNQRIDAPVLLEEIGIVSGFHAVEAYKALKYKRIPVLYGKLPK